MSDIRPYSDDYFLDVIEKKIKFEISMKYYVRHNRHPTKEEYEKEWNEWIPALMLNVSNKDIGNFDE